jgi:hypothetical protein
MDEDALITRLEAVLADEKASTASVVRAAEVIARLRGYGVPAVPEADPVLPEAVDLMADLDEPEARRRRRSTGVR